jgi:hypothetical protein
MTNSSMLNRDALKLRKEIFAVAKNMTESGDHYWVFAHVRGMIGMFVRPPFKGALHAPVGYNS